MKELSDFSDTFVLCMMITEWEKRGAAEWVGGTTGDSQDIKRTVYFQTELIVFA